MPIFDVGVVRRQMRPVPPAAAGRILCIMVSRPRLHVLVSTERVTEILFLVLAISLLMVADGYVLIILSRYVGIYLLLAGEAATGLTAAIVIVRSYRNTVDDLHSAVRAGRETKPGFRWIACLWVGAVLLIIPGFVTDALGVLVFVPPFRWLVGSAAVRMAKHGFEELSEHLKLDQ